MLDRNSYIPLYCQLADEILSDIEAGILKPGDKLPSEAEMMEQYNLGRPTIRMALSQLVNKGYLEKERGRGTFCKAPAIPNQFLNVDVILDMADTYFIPYYIKSISSVLAANHCNCIVSDSKDSTVEICSLLKKSMEKGISGVIFQPSHLMEDVPKELQECLQAYRNAGIPYIMIDSIYEDVDSSYITLDECQGGMIAANYLHSLGHQDILLVYMEKFRESILRLTGFQSVCDEKNKKRPILLQYKKQSFSEDLLFALETSKPTAIFCYNDEVAIECMRILREHNFQIPKDISVMGFDDSVLAGASVPPLTTITHPKQIIGELAASVLLELIQKQRPWPYTNVFSPQLFERESCAQLVK